MHFSLFPALPIIQDALIALLIVYGFITYFRRKRSDNACCVQLSPILLWIGSVACVFFSIPVNLFGPAEEPKFVWHFFEAFLLLNAAMLLAYCNETIRYDDAQFEARDLFGRKRVFRYGEITGLSRRGQDAILHCGRKKVRLDTLAEGTVDFIKQADKAYFRQYQKRIPNLPRKKDPMNGNLDTPWLYFFVSLIICLLTAAMLCFFGYQILRPADGRVPKNAAKIQTSFSYYEQTGKHDLLRLYAPDNEKPYELGNLSGYEISLPDPDTLCGGETFTLTVSEGTREYTIYTISTADGRQLISPLDRDIAYKNASHTTFIVLSVLSAVGFLFSISVIIVGRHPERFPAWLRKLYFQDTAWVGRYGESLHPSGNKKRKKKRKEKK